MSSIGTRVPAPQNKFRWRNKFTSRLHEPGVQYFRELIPSRYYIDSDYQIGTISSDQLTPWINIDTGRTKYLVLGTTDSTGIRIICVGHYLQLLRRMRWRITDTR